MERGTDGTTGEHGALIDAAWREQRLFTVDLSALVELLDPDVVGEVDLGPDDSRPLQVGRDRVGLNLLRFFGGTRWVTLVPHPLNGDLGALAFRDRQLVGLLTLQTRDSRIVDIHAIADPSKLALASLQFGAREWVASA